MRGQYMKKELPDELMFLKNKKMEQK